MKTNYRKERGYKSRTQGGQLENARDKTVLVGFRLPGAVVVWRVCLHALLPFTAALTCAHDSDQRRAAMNLSRQ
ncbi:hypothetical protein O3P69_008613 [Scylla paramamosain]|uniref:Uncharacterized protein n=1 Tax=Scylla paramamosain TaxID=85552 RepID=A0AAW0SKU4_SCYPA